MRYRLKTIGLAIIGLLGASMPIILVNFFLLHYARIDGQKKLDVLANRMLIHAETEIRGAANELRNLADAGIATCSLPNRAAMRESFYRHYSIKAIFLSDESGSNTCSYSGETIDVIGLSEPFTVKDSPAILQMVDPRGSGLTSLMISMPVDEAGSKTINALLPSRIFVPDDVLRSAGTRGQVQVTLDDGSIIGSTILVAGEQSLVEDDVVLSRSTSDTFPVRVLTVERFSSIWGGFGDMRTYTNLGFAFVGLSILLIVVYIGRRQSRAADELERGIENGELIPYYQPVISLETGKLAGCEVLIRWRKPDGTMISPANFIGLAETSGLGLPMTRKLMETVRNELGAVYRERQEMKIAFNLFGDHFDNIDIIKDLGDIFGPSGIGYNQLVMEITERQPLANVEKAKVIIRQLQAMGVRIALDDVGTGHSGLAYIQELGIDILKIDKLFIDAICTNKFSGPIVASLKDLANTTGMTIVVEGVETYDQVQVLQELGISEVQGFLFAPPLPGSSFVSLVEAMVPVRRSGDMVLPVDQHVA
ncbi:EAL domain-containing protein [Coralliovum pocilloporae]|uniref:EAL domain-containing protein n=1 Tax=Coralliovum pocilloporae TaxID=3066369 RepID=UPI0033071E5C